MQSSILRFPKTDRVVTIRSSLAIACENNICAAALLNFFTEWHNIKLVQKAYAEQGCEDFTSSLWQYHTHKQLQAGIVFYSIAAINIAIQHLEKLHFISTDAPDDLRVARQSNDEAGWFLLMSDNVNTWLDQYDLKTRKPQGHIMPARPPQDKPVPQKDQALQVFSYWRERLGHDKAIADKKRLQLIGDRLKEGFKVTDLYMAIEGCARAPFYQGENDNNKVYDRIQLIFRDATYVEKFIGLAIAHGANVETVLTNVEQHKVAAVSGAPDKKRIESIITCILPYVTANDVSGLRAVRVLIGNDFETAWPAIHRALVVRVEAESGMFTAEHDYRVQTLAAELRK